MRRSRLCCGLIYCSLLLASAFVHAVENFCAITPVATVKDIPNVFSAKQEVDLGEVLAESVRNSSYEIEDSTLDAYLQKLGDGLVGRLPPSDLKFRFILSNTPEANAFSIAGGRVYVSRKLIGFARSEDELAGVLAHELGHIVTHQSGIDFTRFFKALGVTAVTDRKDIEEKFHRLLESGKTFVTSEESHQLQADRVSLELLALSGYKVDALADFYDRLTNNKGRGGNWFTDWMGSTTPDSKRYREMEKTARKFPAQCVQPRLQDSPAQFKEWQTAVVAYDGTGRRENVPGLLSKKALEPPLQDEIHTLRFSYDGKYLIAQDDGSIYVLTREPLQFKFRIEAPEAYPAQFTLDSKRITFYTPELHVEAWSVEEGRRTDVYELASADSCLQTALSPDAKTLACIDFGNALTLFDTASGNRSFERKDVRESSSGYDEGLASYRFTYEIRFVNMGFSLDGRFFLLASKNNTLAVDVLSHHEMPLNGAVKSHLQGGFAFLDEHRFVGYGKSQPASVLTFPDGKIEREIELGSAAPFRVAKGDYILMRPIKDYAVGVLDLHSNTIIRASKTPALDVYGGVAASMLSSGEVALFGASANPVARLALPRGHFGSLRAVDLSDDLNWLAVSTRSRGAVWNLANGTRNYNLKGFHGACFEKDGGLYVDFPKQAKADRAIVRVDLRQSGMSLAQKIEPGKAWQECEYLLSLRSQNGKDQKKDNNKGNEDNEEDEDKRDYRYEGSRLAWKDVLQLPEENETFEVRETASGKLLWERKFGKAVPAIYSDALADVAVFRWRLVADGVRAEAKNITIVNKDSSPAKDYDYLVEVVELTTGKFVTAMILDDNDGAFPITRTMATKDWIVAHDVLGRTLVYSLKTGKCTGKFFGTAKAISPQSGTLAVEHDSGRIGIYDLATMQEVHELVFPFPVSGIGFSRDGKKLVALTTDQMLYVVDPSLPKSH